MDMGSRRQESAGDFATILDRAIAERGVTLSWLQDRLARRGVHVSKSTLSYWRRGQRIPERARSLEVLQEIEDVLNLPEHYLISRIGPSRRQGPDVAVPFDELTGQPGVLAALLEEIGCSDTTGLVSRGGGLTVDVGADRRIHRTTNRMMWRARRNGVSSMPVYLHVPFPATAMPEVRAISGCRVAEQVFDAETGYLAAELVLDRPLSTGETAITEHTIEGVLTEEVRADYTMIAERRVGEGVLWVRFDPSALPSAAESFERVNGEESGREVALIGSTLHHAVQHFGPGEFGLRWDW